MKPTPTTQKLRRLSFELWEQKTWFCPNRTQRIWRRFAKRYSHHLARRASREEIRNAVAVAEAGN